MDIDTILNELAPKITITLEDASNNFSTGPKQSESIVDVVAKFYKNTTEAAVMLSKLKMLNDIKQLTTVSLEDVVGFMELLKPENHPKKLIFSKDRSTSGLDALANSVSLEEESVVNPLKATLEANAAILKDLLAKYNSETELFKNLYISIADLKTEVTGVDFSGVSTITYNNTRSNPIDYPLGLLIVDKITGPDESITSSLKQHFKAIKDEITEFSDEVKHLSGSNEVRAICVGDLITLATTDIAVNSLTHAKNEIHNLSLNYIETAAIDTALDPVTYYTVIYNKYNEIQHALLKEIKIINVIIAILVPIAEIVKTYKKLTTPVAPASAPTTT